VVLDTPLTFTDMCRVCRQTSLTVAATYLVTLSFVMVEYSVQYDNFGEVLGLSTP